MLFFELKNLIKISVFLFLILHFLMKKLEIKDYNRKIKMIYKGECRVFEKTAY